MSARPITVPWGIFGAGNLGDDAALAGFDRLCTTLDPRPAVRVVSRNARHSQAIAPSFRYISHDHRLGRMSAIFGAGSVAIVGDTPIMDYLGEWPLRQIARIVRLATWSGKPVTMVGVGTEDLMSPNSVGLVSDLLAENVLYWTVRSAADRVRLMNYGVPDDRISVAADLAWLVESTGAEARSAPRPHARPTLGVNVVNEDWVTSRDPSIWSTIANALDGLSAVFDVRFLANDVRDHAESDLEAARRVRASMTVSTSPLEDRGYISPSQARRAIALCDITIGMRYHFCLFSAQEGIPFLSLTRLGKMRDLCRDLGWTNELEIGSVRSDEIVEHVEALYEQRSKYRQQLLDAMPAMHRRSLDNGAGLIPLLTTTT